MAVLAITAATVVTLGSIVNHFVLDNAIPDFDAGWEDSLNNWITVVAGGIGALAAALHAYFVPVRRRLFGVLAAALAFLSLDDESQFHERINDNLDGRLDPIPGPIADHIEVVVFAPLYAAVFLIVWALAREASAPAGRFLRLGLMLLVAAVVVDVGAALTEELEPEGSAWPHLTRIAFEEGLEVSGWILISGTLTILLCLALLDTGLRDRAQPPTRAAPSSPSSWSSTRPR